MYQNYGNVFIKRVNDSAFIPINEANKDYREYLAWVAEGNVAEFIEYDVI